MAISTAVILDLDIKNRLALERLRGLVDLLDTVDSEREQQFKGLEQINQDLLAQNLQNTEALKKAEATLRDALKEKEQQTQDLYLKNRDLQTKLDITVRDLETIKRLALDSVVLLKKLNEENKELWEHFQTAVAIPAVLLAQVKALVPTELMSQERILVPGYEMHKAVLQQAPSSAPGMMPLVFPGDANSSGPGVIALQRVGVALGEQVLADKMHKNAANFPGTSFEEGKEKPKAA